MSPQTLIDLLDNRAHTADDDGVPIAAPVLLTQLDEDLADDLDRIVRGAAEEQREHDRQEQQRLARLREVARFD